MSKCNLINAENLFANVIPQMIDKSRMVQEIVENAMRANATRLDFRLEKDGDEAWFHAENDGDVLQEFIHLLKIAQSSYDPEVITAQNPAGMGVMSYLAVSSECCFHSGAQQLCVESKRFFEEAEYRETILDAITQTEHFKGMRVAMRIEGGTEFITSYFSPREAAGGNEVDAPALQYYPIRISYNGMELAQAEPSLLVETIGSGPFEGMRIGIAANYRAHPVERRETGVFWFGKHIQCSLLEPFTIVVDRRCELLQPRLPDRTALINTIDEQKAIRDMLETQLHNAIQAYLMEHENTALLQHLQQAYDVEHFTRWHDAVRGETKLVVQTDTILFSKVQSNADLLEAPVVLGTRAQADFGDAPIVEGYNSGYGFTPPPKWYRELLLRRPPHIVAYGTPRRHNAARAGSNYIYPAEQLLLEGYAITAFADEEYEAYVSIEDDADPYDFFLSLAEALDDFNTDAEFDNLCDSYSAMLDAYSGKIRGVRPLLDNLLAMAGTPYSDTVTSIDIDLEAHTVTYTVNGGEPITVGYSKTEY